MASDIGNMLLLKKIVYFLRGIKDVPPKRRYGMIAEIDNSPKHKIKVGERLLYILNRSDDHDKASLIAQLFKAFLNKNIEYNDFLKGSYILNSIFINDFDTFLKLDKQNLHADEIMPFVSYGLCNILFCTPELVHHEQENRHDPPAYDAIEGAEPICEITDIGIKLRIVFDGTL